MKKIYRMILLEIGPERKFTDGSQYKHVFMKEDGSEQVCFCETDEYRGDVQAALKWDDSKAHNFLVNERAPFDGKEKLPHLIPKKEALLFLKGANEKF